MLAVTQDLGPMFADLQARCVDCLNGVGDQIDSATATLAKVEQQIKARALAPPAPLQPPGPDALPPKFAHILARVSSCLSAVAGSHFCKGADVDNVLSACKFLDTLTKNAPPMPSSASTDVLSAADAIMSLPTELQLLDDDEDSSHASKRVRLAHDPYGPSDPVVSSDVGVVPPFPSPPGPDSDPRTAPSDPGVAPSQTQLPRKRVTGKSPPAPVASSSQCNQWGTLCQVFEIGSPKGVSRDAAFVDASFEAAMSPPPEGISLNDSIVSETLSSVESMDEDHAPSAEVVRAVPNVKAAASLKPPSSSKNPSINLSPQQKRNLAKKLRKQSRQAAAV